MRRRAGERGLTLLEVLVAAMITVMIATMIWTAFDQTAKMRMKLGARQENDHLARIALTRITRDLRSAFLSLHVNQNQTLVTSTTAFVGKTLNGSGQLDMTTFTHRRLQRAAHEGDACEVGYRVEPHRGDDTVRGFDLLRRESARIDADPLHGGVVDVLMPGIQRFELKFYDPNSEEWVDTWDTTQATGPVGRLPSRVHLAIVLDEGNPPTQRTYVTETSLFITRPLTFGLPIY